MELSSLLKQGLRRANVLLRSIMTCENTDSLRAQAKALWMRYHTVMRPFERIVLQLIVRLADGPGTNLMLFGLRLWLGALLLRKGVTTLFLLYKLVRRQMTSVLSIGTGASKSVARRDAWRMTVPVREVGLAPLYVLQYGCYTTVTVGSVLVAAGLFERGSLAPRRCGQALPTRCAFSPDS